MGVTNTTNKYQDQAKKTGQPVVRNSPTGATVTYQPRKLPTGGGYQPTSVDNADRQAQGFYAQGGKAWDDPTATGENLFAWDRSQGRFINAANQMTTGTPGAPPAAPHSPRGGGGGGGAGAAAAAAKQAADWQAYLSAMKGVMGQIRPAAVPLAGKVDPAVDADIAAARAAYGQVASGIPMNDPYLALASMQAPTVQPEMRQFLESQGVQGGQYGDAVNYANQQLAAGAQNWQGYAQAQGANHLAAQQRIADLAKLQGENTVQGLEGQRMLLNAQVAQQQAAAEEQARQQKLQLVLQMISAAGQAGQAAPDVTGLL